MSTGFLELVDCGAQLVWRERDGAGREVGAEASIRLGPDVVVHSLAVRFRPARRQSSAGHASGIGVRWAGAVPGGGGQVLPSGLIATAVTQPVITWTPTRHRHAG